MQLILQKVEEMSFMKGDLLTKTRKLVKGLAKAEPVWLKAMEQYVNYFFHDFLPQNYNVISPRGKSDTEK